VEQTACQVKIPVFEGPLDLLLHLIRKSEVDIYDIPVALITSQYLEYLNLMKSLNIEVAGEFLVMAATLILIKSRMLLPRTEDGQDEEDPRLEIALPLLDYIRFKEAGRWLERRPWLERDVFLRGLNPDIDPPGQEERPLFNLSLFELIDAFKEIMDKVSQEAPLTVRMGEVSLAERIADLMEVFRQEESRRFEDLFQAGQGLTELIITFLAILELARMGFVDIYQEAPFGAIRLAARREAFDIEEYKDDLG